MVGLFLANPDITNLMPHREFRPRGISAESPADREVQDDVMGLPQRILPFPVLS